MSGVLKNMELDLDITSGQLKYVPSPNFSYKTIPVGCCMKVPQYQEMILSEIINIEGNLNLQGDLTFTDSISGIDTIKEFSVNIPTHLSQLSEDSTHRTVSDNDIINWNKAIWPDEPITASETINGKQTFRSLLSRLNNDNKKLCWVGDSITEQGKPGIGNGIGFTTIIQQKYPNITYFNEGIGGNTTIDVINRLNTIISHSADLYVVAIGINDARYNDVRGATTQNEYISNMSTIIDTLINTGAKVVVISIFPSFYKDQFANLKRFLTDLRFEEWNMALAKLSKTKNITFIDSYTTIKKYITLYNVDTLIPDGVHPDQNATDGKTLYALSILTDNIPKGLLSNEYTVSGETGTFFYKLVIHDGDPGNIRGTGGYCGIKHINILPYHKEVIAKTGNTSYTSQYLFGTYNSSYLGFYNLQNDYPFIIYFSTDQEPTQLGITGIVSGINNAHRGVRTYDLYFTKNREAFGNENHQAWNLIYSEKKTDAIIVNLLPKVRNNIFYKLEVSSIGNSQTAIKLKQIGGKIPIRVYYQGIDTSSLHRYPILFTTGLTLESDSLTCTTPTLYLCWEAEEELSSVILSSFNSSIGNWTLSKSYISTDITSVSSTTWKQIATGTGDQTVSLSVIPTIPTKTSELTNDSGFITGIDHNSTTNRDIAGNHTKLIPSIDSTTAIQITKNDGSTVLLNADSTNKRIGIGVSDPAVPLEVLSASQKGIYIRDGSLAHGITSLAPTNVFFSMEEYGSAGSGGSIFRSLSGNSNSVSPIFFQGVSGHASPIVPIIMFRGGKKSGTSYTSVATTEGLIGFDNYTTRLITILGNGYTGFGINPPTSTVHISGSIANKVTTITINTTLNGTHNVIFCNSDTALSVTLPTASTCTDREYVIKNINLGTVTIIGTIDGVTNPTLASQYKYIKIISNGTSWFNIGSN